VAAVVADGDQLIARLVEDALVFLNRIQPARLLDEAAGVADDAAEGAWLLVGLARQRRDLAGIGSWLRAGRAARASPSHRHR
jgi:hypothetical protein